MFTTRRKNIGKPYLRQIDDLLICFYVNYQQSFMHSVPDYYVVYTEFYKLGYVQFIQKKLEVNEKLEGTHPW